MDTNEFLLLWLGFDRMFTVQWDIATEKCDLFICLLIYRAQKEHKMNMVDPDPDIQIHIQIISIIALDILLFDTKKFFGQDRIQIGQFFAAIVWWKIFIA